MPVYFAQPTDGGPVKIGHSANVPARLRQLEGHYGRPLALLATMPGGLDEEREIHGRFAHLRFGKTEQFRPGADLMKFIGRPLLVSANSEAVEVMSGATSRNNGKFVILATGDMKEWIDGAMEATGHSVSAKLWRTAMRALAERHGLRMPPAI